MVNGKTREWMSECIDIRPTPGGGGGVPRREDQSEDDYLMCLLIPISIIIFDGVVVVVVIHLFVLNHTKITHYIKNTLSYSIY